MLGNGYYGNCKWRRILLKNTTVILGHLLSLTFKSICTFNTFQATDFYMCLNHQLPKNIWWVKECGVSISRFVLEKPDSTRFLHDIIFYLKSGSIVVSFSLGTAFLRVDVLQFWFQHTTRDFLSSCLYVELLLLSTTYEREMWSTRIQSLSKSTKRTNPVSHWRFPYQLLFKIPRDMYSCM